MAYNQMRETPPVISDNQMRETPTFAHLSSVFKSDGCQVSDVALLGHRENARKQGLLGQSQFQMYSKIELCQTAFWRKIAAAELFLG